MSDPEDFKPDQVVRAYTGQEYLRHMRLAGWDERYNTDTSRREVHVAGEWEPKDRHHAAAMRIGVLDLIRGEDRKVSLSAYEDAVLAARFNIEVSPETERIKALLKTHPADLMCCDEAPGIQCIYEHLLMNMYHVADMPGELVNMASRFLFLGPTERLLIPGVKQDVVVVLIGSEGIGKSSLLRWTRYDESRFVDIPGNEFEKMDTKEFIERTYGAGLVEIQEANFTGRNADAVKARISTGIDLARLAFQGMESDGMASRYKRRGSLIATGNHLDALPPAEENRRFLPVHLRKPYMNYEAMHGYMETHRPFFEAQALRDFYNGVRTQPDGPITMLLTAHNREFIEIDQDFVDAIRDVLPDREIATTAASLWNHCRNNGKLNVQNIARFHNRSNEGKTWVTAMHNVGFQKQSVRGRFTDFYSGKTRNGPHFTYAPQK